MAAPPPARVPPPPAAPMRPPSMAPAVPQQQQPSFMGQMASNVASGMAIGTGSAIAHRAVGALFGGGGWSAPAQAPAAPCAEMQNAFVKCLQDNNNNADVCRNFYDALNQCQMQHGA